MFQVKNGTMKLSESNIFREYAIKLADVLVLKGKAAYYLFTGIQSLGSLSRQHQRMTWVTMRLKLDTTRRRSFFRVLYRNLALLHLCVLLLTMHSLFCCKINIPYYKNVENLISAHSPTSPPGLFTLGTRLPTLKVQNLISAQGD